MILAHKTRIRTANPGSAIANALAQHDGAARWAYNNLLASLKDGIESSSGGLWPSVGALAKTLRREKPAWWASVDWEMLDNGRLRLDTALKRWRQCRTGKHGWHQPGTCGFPQFHKRGDRKAITFSSHVGDGRRVKWLDNRHLALPGIGTITLAEALPEVGWLKEVHAVREGGKWYAVLVYENGRQLPDASGDGAVVGVDVGINKAIARSIQLNPNRRTNRRARLYEQRARLQSQQAHRRQTHHRQTASAIAKSAGTVVVESLNVAGMVRNRHLAKALTDAAVGGFLRELQWQCAKRGVQVPHSGDVVPKYSTMRSVRRTARRADRPVGADVSLRALRVALRPGPQRGPEPETSRPCFMGDDKRTWRRCKSGTRAGGCQRSVYWTWQSPTGPDSGVMRRLWSIMAIMPNPS